MAMILRQAARITIAPVSGAVVAVSLFLIMQYLIAVTDQEKKDESPRYNVEMVKVEDEPPPLDDIQEQLPEVEEMIQEAKNVPNPAPNMSTPGPTGAPVGIGDLSVNDVDIGFEFDAGLGGGLVGISGLGSGDGDGTRKFTGKALTPVSTGRPQCPAYAVDNKIEGYVDLLFIVDKDGQVRNPRIFNASPKGIFEAAAVEAVSAWQYSRSDMAGGAREVKQRFEFKLKDCAMDWRTRR
ncbi:MAG: protein TonB [Pseudoalteromonas tetraodonis]|jgi:protein TonB